MKGLCGIIFDCDGVLFESRQANLEYYNTVFSIMGEAPVREEDRERAHLCHTAASPVVFEVILGRERLREALDIASKIDYRQFIPFMTPEPGMVETLDCLSGRFPLAVATNRGTSMKDILSHYDLDRYFRAVITSRDVERPKPYPDMLHLASERLGIKEKDLLFVGDSELDREAALQAGVTFASYKSGVESDYPINEYCDLMHLLDFPDGGF